jgi:hypothetical protein
MVVFIPTSGESVAQALSNSLWSLALPVALRGNAVTQTMFETITCLDQSIWLAVDTTFSVNVHAEAEIDGIADIMQPWIDRGLLADDTNATLDALIRSKRGQSLVVYDAFPQLFKDQSKTYDELVALGLLHSSDL